MTTRDELMTALRRAIDDDGLTVINAAVDPEAGALLKSDRLVSTILFDDVRDHRQ